MAPDKPDKREQANAVPWNPRPFLRGLLGGLWVGLFALVVSMCAEWPGFRVGGALLAASAILIFPAA